MTFTLRKWLEFESDKRRALLDDCRSAAAASKSSHNAYISVVDDIALPLSDGELAGVPFAVKDNIDVAGTPTTGGSPLFARDVPEVDAGVVSALREAGAVVVGKTNLHELAFGVTNNNATYGPVRNPLDVSRVAGGSSGGSAAAVALGTVPFSLGTDTGGSVTIPSAFCGIVGFRPTTGRYPSDGVINLSSSRDTIGIHARTVEDVRLVDRVVTSASATIGVSDPSDLVLGTVTSRFEDMEPAVAEATQLALDDLRNSGVTIVELPMPDDLKLAATPGIDLVLYEAERLLAARVNNGRGQTGSIADLTDSIESPDVRAIFETIAATPVTASAYEQARRARWQLRRLYEETFAASGVHALIAPTVHVLPPLIGQDDTIDVNGQPQPVFPTVTRNTAPGSVAGVPMLSIPGRSTPAGLSVGLCLEGRFFDDRHLLAVGELLSDVLHR
ncbi:amidase [Rhodococcus opacus]|nr:amidase [Rhodococcus opacus]